jgi:hypothetical protein
MEEPTAKHAAPTMVAGIDLRCEICRHDHFFERRGQLNTTLASFLNFDWIDPIARCLICANCGYIHWFAPEKLLRKK